MTLNCWNNYINIAKGCDNIWNYHSLGHFWDTYFSVVKFVVKNIPLLSKTGWTKCGFLRADNNSKILIKVPSRVWQILRLTDRHSQRSLTWSAQQIDNLPPPSSWLEDDECLSGWHYVGPGSLRAGSQVREIEWHPQLSENIGGARKTSQRGSYEWENLAIGGTLRLSVSLKRRIQYFKYLFFEWSKSSL